MRHAYTLFFLAWGAVLVLSAIKDLVKGKALPDVAAVGCMGLIGVALAVGVWIFTGKLQEGRPAAAAAVERTAHAAPARPAVSQAALARRMSGQLTTALAFWLAVVVLISLVGTVLLHDKTYALTTGLHRFGALFWKAFLIVLAADLVLWLANFTWVNDEPGPGWFSKGIAIAFAALPVLVGVLGLTSLFNGRDPWEYLPGGPPFALRQFAAKHPQLHIETVGPLGGDTVEVTRGSSPRVIYSEGDLREAQLTWEKCADAGAPARLGGPQPYPNSQCLFRIETRRPDYDALSEEDLDRDVPPPDMRTVRYVYSVGWEYTSKVKEHFLNWAKSVGPEPNVYGYYWMEVTAGGKNWTIDMRARKKTVNDVYVEYTERRPPAPRRDE